MQLANATLTEVRRRVTLQVRGRPGRKGNREWELPNRLTRPAARIRGEHVDALVDGHSALPAAIATPILAAWNAKEDLLDLLALACTHPDRVQVARRPHRFYIRLAAAVPAHTGITNAGSEGANRQVAIASLDRRVGRCRGRSG